jgi:site-specific recombinase XerD
MHIETAYDRHRGLLELLCCAHIVRLWRGVPSHVIFLAEKHRRSGSKRTVDAYSRMLQEFFGRVGKTPDQATSQDIFAWAYGIGLSGKEPSAITIGARLACLSSYNRFLIRMKVVAANPCDAIERPRVSPSPAKGLDADSIRKLLAVIPDTPVGLRDRAIILTLVLTGRRRAEVLGMKAGDVSFEGGTCFYTYRGKGGKSGRRELPRPALEAVQEWLAAAGRDLTALGPEESLWPDTKNGRGITSGTFYTNLRKYLRKAGLPLSGVHVFRHSAAKLRRDAGESIEDVSRFLDHSSLAVTTTYLRRLEGQEDLTWAKVAEAIGL